MDDRDDDLDENDPSRSSEKTEQYGNSLDIECPVCGAKEGLPCDIYRQGLRSMGTVHTERRVASEEGDGDDRESENPIRDLCTMVANAEFDERTGELALHAASPGGPEIV